MKNKPKRIQRKRTRGWKMPYNAIYVGRPTKWGNPFDKRMYPNINECLFHYGRWLIASMHLQKLDPKELKGKNLACFCPLDKPCHADILLGYANRN